MLCAEPPRAVDSVLPIRRSSTRLLLRPLRDQRAGDAARAQPRKIFIAEGDEHGRRAAVRRLPRAVGPVEVNAIGQEQDAACALPHRLKPAGFGARVQQRGAAAVVGELLDPRADLIAVERRVQTNTADPRRRETIIRSVIVALGAIPRARVRGGRIEIERSDRIDDPLRGAVGLRPSDRRLVRAERHGPTLLMTALEVSNFVERFSNSFGILDFQIGYRLFDVVAPSRPARRLNSLLDALASVAASGGLIAAMAAAT